MPQLSDTIAANEAGEHFAELLDRVEDGAEVTITRNGSPVAKVVPVKRKSTQAERAEAIRSWREKAKGLSLGGLKIRDLINEGRK